MVPDLSHRFRHTRSELYSTLLLHFAHRLKRSDYSSWRKRKRPSGSIQSMVPRRLRDWPGKSVGDPTIRRSEPTLPACLPP